MVCDLAEQQRVGVEKTIHVADVTRAKPARQNSGVAVEAESPTDARVVGDVARALLQIAHQAAPLEDLREHVGGLLAGQMNAAELGH